MRANNSPTVVSFLWRSLSTMRNRPSSTATWLAQVFQFGRTFAIDLCGSDLPLGNRCRRRTQIGVDIDDLDSDIRHGICSFHTWQVVRDNKAGTRFLRRVPAFSFTAVRPAIGHTPIADIPKSKSDTDSWPDP